MKVFEIISSIILIVSIYYCGRVSSMKLGWSLYIIANLLFSGVMYFNELYFMMIVGIILLILGIKNLIGVINE